MCGDPFGWMCDECFAKRQCSEEEIDLCAECRHVSEQMCFCCMTQQDTALSGDLCDMCKTTL